MAAVISPVDVFVYKGEKMVISEDELGPLTRELYDAIVAIQYAQAPDPHGWTVEVE